jgi:hypothetical protein
MLAASSRMTGRAWSPEPGPGPGDVAAELAGDVLRVAVIALDVAEYEGIVAGQLQRQGAALAGP